MKQPRMSLKDFRASGLAMRNQSDNWTEDDLKGRSVRPTPRIVADSAVKDVEAGRVDKKAVEPLTFTLALPPSLNHLYPTVNGRRYLSKEGQKFKKVAVQEVQNAALLAGWRYPSGARISLRLAVITRTARADLSNIIKICEDSIAAGLNFNDRVVDYVEVKRVGIDRFGAEVKVTVSIMKGE